jgi:hypothetical protein
MPEPTSVMRIAAWWVFASVFALACDSSVDASLERKECTRSGECLPGWTCSEDQLCVRAASRDDPQEPVPDASTSDAGGGITLPMPTSPASCSEGMACNGACVDVTKDADNCGACGQRCIGNDNGRAVCTAGACGIVCDEDYTRCGDGCYRLNADPQHCGSCTFSCPTAQNGDVACAEGMCRSTCNAGFVDCAGVCARTATDARNCGACGVACPAGEQCAGGTCVKMCPAGSIECNHSCVDLKTDAMNCGMCGNACPATPTASPVCAAGACATQCNTGLTACGSACLNLQTDLLNCGTCGNACPPTASRSHPICAAASCKPECDAGFVACEDQCVSQLFLDQFMGRATCAAIAMMQDRYMCQGMTNNNTTYCAGTCVNVTTNKQHCGRCDRACTGGQSCFGGVCL